GAWVEQAKHAAEGVVRRQAIGEGEEGLEPVLFGDAIVGDLDPTVGPTNDGTDSDDDNVHRLCSRVRSMRGSCRSAKWVWIAKAGFGWAMGLLRERARSRGIFRS